MLEKLIEISDHRKRLEVVIKKQKSDFEDSLSLQKAQLNDLVETENKLREEAILQLEKENKTSEKVGDKTISRQVKKTLKITDPRQLRENLSSIKPEDYGFSEKITTEAFEDTVIIKDKPTVNMFIDAFEKVEGKLLSGVELSETKYLIIK